MSNEEQMAEIRATILDITEIQRKQARLVRQHSEWIADIDERLERVGHHLEVIVQIADGLIRDHTATAKIQEITERLDNLEGGR